MPSLDTFSQGIIFVLGVTAIILVSRKNKWGFICGLLSQPFWFITTISNHQWPLVAMSVVYTVSWIYGVWQWFRPKPILTPSD